jgi:hypothetical protein
MWNMHMTECLSYATLMPAFALRTPQVWFTCWDEAGKQGIVIMEDLVLRGVEFCKPTQPQGFDAIAARVTELARLHAGTWDSPELREGGRWGWMSDTPERILDFMGPLLEADVWDSFVASPRGAAASTRFHDRHWMREAMERTAVFARDLPRCACHGDTHLGNLYVDVDGTPGFFDCISYKAPGMYEVTYHLACALDLADRPAMERPLVQHYLDALRGHGIAAPSIDEAMDQFAAFLAYGYLIFIVNDAIFQPEAYNTAYTARFSAAMLDHHTKERLAEVA